VCRIALLAVRTVRGAFQLKRALTLAADGSLAPRTAPQAPEPAGAAAGLGGADIPDRFIDQFLIAQRYAGPLHARAWQPNMRNPPGFFFFDWL
jgi:hypothetical protein